MYNSPLPADQDPITGPSGSRNPSLVNLTNVNTASYPSEIDLGTYIVARWKQLGVGNVFGVPGDFNLVFLDYIEGDDQVNWVGTCSELGAGYAADGYARVKGSMSVFVTTYGVGELSALNPFAGMQSERLPSLHVVGLPPRPAFAAHKLLHHTLADGDLDVFVDMSRRIAQGDFATEVIGLVKGSDGEKEDNSEKWTTAVDGLIKTALKERRPVYMGLPSDMVTRKVSSAPLSTPILDVTALNSSKVDQPKLVSNPAADELVSHIIESVKQAKQPVVIGDFYAQRFGFQKHARALVKQLGVQHVGTHLAKSMFDECSPLYCGIYAGRFSDESEKTVVEEADLIVRLGGLDTDFNTGMFTSKIPEERIEINLDHTMYLNKRYEGLGLEAVLSRLATAAASSGIAALKSQDRVSVDATKGNNVHDKQKLDHAYFWDRVETFFKEDDVIFSDVGTCSMGLVNAKIPTRAQLHFQHLWGSIGWSTGAVLGGAMASRELNASNPPRVINFIGDGALQMNLQEIATIIRNKIPVYYFINNNDGYEIERQIHGVKAVYNDIQPIDHVMLIKALAGPMFDDFCQTYRVKTRQELNDLLLDDEFNTPGKFKMVEFYLPRDDAPRVLKNAHSMINVPDDLVQLNNAKTSVLPADLSEDKPVQPVSQGLKV